MIQKLIEYKSTCSQTLAMACAMVLSGSATTLPSLADEAVYVSPTVAFEFRQFQRVDLLGYFAVSRNGRQSGFTYCRSKQECNSSVADLALRFCNEKAENSNCQILFAPQKPRTTTNFRMPSDSLIGLVEKGWQSFFAKADWKGYRAASRGWMMIPPGNTTVGWLKFAPFGSAFISNACFGSYSMVHANLGTWMLACPGGRAALGTLERQKRYWSSKGRDLKGNTVSMTTFFD